jgi:4,5-DOPA dioxygenase extradiol
MSFRFPTLFLSHGTPMLAHGNDPYQEMLEKFSASIPKPKAIVFLSAHSLSADQIHILKSEKNRIQYDFGGFPEELYQIKYECAGDPALADQLATLFTEAGFQTGFDQNAPLDHGIWIPLRHLYPKGDVPVVRVSLPLGLIPAQILKMGHVIAKLREQGILIIGTGGAVHNLREMQWSAKNSGGPAWAQEFEQWLMTSLMKKDVDALLTAEEHAHFAKAHPSNEHFLPLLFTVGSALQGDQITILYQGIEYDSLSMLCFSLNHEQKTSLH